MNFFSDTVTATEIIIIIIIITTSMALNLKSVYLYVIFHLLQQSMVRLAT